MCLKTRVLLAVGYVSLLSMSIPAVSNPAPRGFAHHHSNIHKKKIVHSARLFHAKPHVVRESDAAHLVSMPIAEPPKQPLFGWPALVREARKYMGTNPTARTKLWCATFMNLVLARVGYAGTNSDAAKSFADYGHRISEPEIGAIAVLSRGRSGGHVGVVSGIDPHGNPIIISGNHGHRVGEAVYPRARVIAYVMPSERRPDGETQVAERASPVAPSTPSASNTLSAQSMQSTQSTHSVVSARSVPRPPSLQSAPNRARPEPVIDSPITELLAAIEAEQNRAQGNARLARAQAPPHRIVQRMPGRTLKVAQRPAPQAMPPARRDVPLDPALARLLGVKAHAPLPAQRQQPTLQRGRIARADIALAARQPAPR